MFICLIICLEERRKIMKLTLLTYITSLFFIKFLECKKIKTKKKKKNFFFFFFLVRIFNFKKEVYNFF